MEALEAGERAAALLHIAEDARSGGTNLHARGLQIFGDAVVAEGAFVRRLSARIQVTGSVRTRLYAVAAADAVVLIHQHHALLARKGCAYGTDLHAGSVVAVVAQLGHKEGAQDSLFVAGRREAVDAPVGTVDRSLTVVVDHIAFHPGAKVERLAQDVVLVLAGIGTA